MGQMSQEKTNTILKCQFVFWLLFLVAANAFADCSTTPPSKSDRDLTWIKSDDLIFGAMGSKLLRIGFNSKKSATLAEHNFDYISSFELSPTGSFISYEGFKPQNGFSHFLYEIDTGLELEIPLRRLDKIAFSPDGSKAVWTDISTNGTPQTVTIIDLHSKNLLSETFKFPLDVRTLKDYRMTEAWWTRDSNTVLLGSIAYPNGAYFSFNVTHKRFDRIQGRFHPFHDYKDSADYGLHFISNGEEIVYYRPPCMQWQCGDQGLPANGVTVYLNKDHDLMVKYANGKQELVEHGSYNDCQSETIGPVSWLNNGRYFTYSKDGTYYIYGVEEKRKAILFEGGQVYFGWNSQINRVEFRL